jgi:N-acetylmuramoyl-L-alanine amidase
MLDLSKIKFVPSPNFQPRGGNKPEIIVLHCPIGTFNSCVDTFKNPQSKVSAHYVVDRSGEMVQMVSLDNAAWHAMHYPNMIGIGIEMVDRYFVGGYLTRGCMNDPQWFTTEELAATADLVAALMQKFNIPITKVMGHNDPWLKQYGNNHRDPGPAFPWFNFRKLVTDRLAVSTSVTESAQVTKLAEPLVMLPQAKQRKPRGRKLKRKNWKN